MNNVLVIGNGGREHRIVLSLLSSTNVKNVYIINGNGGTSSHNINISPSNHEEVLKFINANDITLTIIGPEVHLSEGIVDFLEANKKIVFGPSKEAAKLESSKIFMKDVLTKAGVPTAKYKTFTSTEEVEAIKFINEFKSSVVIKTDGLAAGKGVVIAESKEDAIKEVKEFFAGKFGDAGKSIVLEEFLDGFEVSLFGISDGTNVICFGSACDHKRIFDNDLGLNTGGMGTFSPSFLSLQEEEELTKKLIVPVVEELKRRGIIYKGVLFAGLMISESEVKVLEFNARFGDPETQSLLSRFEGDFYEVCLKSAEGKLNGYKPKFSTQTAVSVVIASRGYPESSSKGDEITLPKTLQNNEFIFHAGTILETDILKTNGGRVLAVTALGETKKEARDKAYQIASQIKFEGMQFRKDIAEDLVAFDINFEEEKWKQCGIGFYDFFKRLLKVTLKTHFQVAKQDYETYEFSILLTNDAHMQTLNKEHRGQDKPTNVLSFPLNVSYEEGKVLMGDIVVSLDIMRQEALEQEKSFKEHLAHLFVHSALHLLGYDHEEEDEMKIMENLEDKILNIVLS